MKTLLCAIRFAGNCLTDEKTFPIYIQGTVNPPNLLKAWHKLNDRRNKNLAIECEILKNYKGGKLNINLAAGVSLLDLVMNMETCVEDYVLGGLSFNSKAEAIACIKLTNRLLVSASIQPNYKPIAERSV